jgi:hypothetical protein
MATTTRRPQINHKACSHAATPKARKACRKAARAAEAQVATGRVAHDQVAATPNANVFRTLHLNHELAYLADGTPVPACSKRRVKIGEAIFLAGWHAGMATCNRCSGATRGHLGR